MKKENACILILAGILCLIVAWPVNKPTDSKENVSYTETSDSEDVLKVYVEREEARLEEFLKDIEGVGQVKAMLRVKTSKEFVVGKDYQTDQNILDETDSQGSMRTDRTENKSEQSIYTKDENGYDIPWITKEIEPVIEGVLIAAEGGDQEMIKQEITQAVQVLFDVPVHKIKVVKMKDS